ncbi:BnaC01g27430D [Brassica napus]|uniref:BnaC01g27430D protein n=2 Tax=Brassica TaxID=3705 RepID=A0A078H2P1_BRANA|nr:BnaC01g27430D [Brassica napus]
MRCDNYCLRCGEPDESATHDIFECPPALQVWSLSATSTSPDIFLVPSIYANMDYLFWRKNNILGPELDRDPYPWLIWFIWKARNDKLFRGIDRDPLEIVRHAESECQACMGKAQLMGTRNHIRRESPLHLEVEVLRWAMENMLQHSTCQSFGTDCKELIAMIKEPRAWPSFATELESIETLQICFLDFKITYVPRTQNQISDSLAKIARSFHRDFYFIGCSIPVWLPRPPQL